MAHIACDEHRKRVMFFPDRIIHRSDGSKCDSFTFTTGGLTKLQPSLKRIAKTRIAALTDAWSDDFYMGRPPRFTE